MSLNHLNYLNYLCQQALLNLAAAKLRSFLAVLGILVGTAAVVALMSSGTLATEKALAEFKTLGTDLLSVMIYQKNPQISHQGNNQLSLAAWRQIPQKISDIQAIAPYAQASQTINFRGKTMNGSIIATDEALTKIIHIELASGRFISFMDSFEHFCVLGNRLAEQIQNEEGVSPLHQRIQIGRLVYTVIGIAKPWKESAFFNDDINSAVIVPIQGLSLVNPDSKISNAVLKLKPNSPLDAVVNQLQQVLHQEAPALSLFTRSPKQMIASMESQSRIFTWLLVIIGSISLLVGGIGIMNVMLVSVSERKKEIGIRKAVGAKNRQIQALFLMESVILSLSGGFIGVALGLLVTCLLAYFCDWHFVMHWNPPLVGFTVSIVTGIFFGFYPAKRASTLDAAVSLRSE